VNEEAKSPYQPENPPKEAPDFRKDLGEEMNVAAVHDSILREQADPEDGYEPIPLWLVTVIMVVVFWAGLYLAYNSGGFQANVFDPTLVSWTGGGAGAADAGPPDPMVLGRRIFTQNCVVCHQATGQGVAGQFPPLVDSEWVLSTGWHGDNHLVKLLLHGLQGVIEVKGNIYNNAMPAQNLNDAQISAVLTYIRNEWGNSAAPISEQFVAKIREETAGRAEPWTQPELQAIERVLESELPPPPAPAEEAVLPPTESASAAPQTPEAS
jgi:mono/diheme cytochrome c family protein